jgi:hypothetical protein
MSRPFLLLRNLLPTPVLKMPTLTGITWNHTRGLNPLLAASEAFTAEFPDVQIHWLARSLHDFGRAPVDQLAREFDLVVLDHPWVGFMAETGCFLPLDDWISADKLAELAAHSAGPSHRSTPGRAGNGPWRSRRRAPRIDLTC